MSPRHVHFIFKLKVKQPTSKHALLTCSNLSSNIATPHPNIDTHVMMYACTYEPVTKGRDLKWDTLPQNQTPSKLFSVLPLESGMFQVTISIIKKWFWSKCVLYGIKTGVRSGVDVCNNVHSECHNNTEKNHLYAILMLLVHLSSC